jgi:hypothetical protein
MLVETQSTSQMDKGTSNAKASCATIVQNKAVTTAAENNSRREWKTLPLSGWL